MASLCCPLMILGEHNGPSCVVYLVLEAQVESRLLLDLELGRKMAESQLTLMAFPLSCAYLVAVTSSFPSQRQILSHQQMLLFLSNDTFVRSFEGSVKGKLAIGVG